jgi:hypothetical protein
MKSLIPDVLKHPANRILGQPVREPLEEQGIDIARSYEDLARP